MGIRAAGGILEMMENILHLDCLNISFLDVALYCTIVLQDVTSGVTGEKAMWEYLLGVFFL